MIKTQTLITKLNEFLHEELKADCFDLDAAVEELEERHMSGHSSYELRAWETKLGRTTELNFNATTKYFMNGAEIDIDATDGEFDDAETTLFWQDENED